MKSLYLVFSLIFSLFLGVIPAYAIDTEIIRADFSNGNTIFWVNPGSGWGGYVNIGKANEIE